MKKKQAVTREYRPRYQKAGKKEKRLLLDEFTRSRDHKKNGHCFVEQKNGAVVREYIGYDRLEGLEEQALLAAVYAPSRPNAPFTTLSFFSRMLIRLFSGCVSGSSRQTASRRMGRISLGNIF